MQRIKIRAVGYDLYCHPVIGFQQIFMGTACIHPIPHTILSVKYPQGIFRRILPTDTIKPRLSFMKGESTRVFIVLQIIQ